jgi:hypothetical protein
MTLKLSQSDAFATPGLHLAFGIFDFSAESGFSKKRLGDSVANTLIDSLGGI